jgi:hypothetical protein
MLQGMGVSGGSRAKPDRTARGLGAGGSARERFFRAAPATLDRDASMRCSCRRRLLPLARDAGQSLDRLSSAAIPTTATKEFEKVFGSGAYIVLLARRRTSSRPVLATDRRARDSD